MRLARDDIGDANLWLISTPWCAVPGGSDVTLIFESFVTKPDLKKALRGHDALATVLGVDLRSDKELDTLFDSYPFEWDGSTAITRRKWRDFVKQLHGMGVARTQACTHN